MRINWRTFTHLIPSSIVLMGLAGAVGCAVTSEDSPFDVGTGGAEAGGESMQTTASDMPGGLTSTTSSSPADAETSSDDDDDDDDDDDGTTRLDVGPQSGESDDALGDCSDSCVDAVDSLPMGSWLLNFGFEGSPLNPSALVLNQVDIESGATKELCSLSGPELEFRNFGFKSATFTRDNRLMTTDGRALYEVDPCECTYERVGRYPEGSGGIFGITPDDGDGLFAASADSRQFVRVDPNTAEVTPISGLGFGLEQHGATYSETDQVVYLVTSTGDVLYKIDPSTGEATELATLSQRIQSVGVEIHPDSNELYVCGTVDNRLSRVDVDTGEVMPLGGGELSNCSNLGAPWSAGGSVCVPQG